ncbi:MAG: tetratricopeptide repeat protein [Bacteroidota bacterium]
MKKIFLVGLVSLGFAFSAKAQTVKEAIKFTDNEQLEKAEAAFKTLVASQPTAENYFYYGENYYKWEKFSQAEAMYKKGLEVKADDALCLIGLGKLMWQDGKTTEAKANFDKALYGNNSKNVKLMLEVADVYIKSEKKDIPAAQALINNVIKIDIKNHDAYILLGDSYLEMNDGSKAIENYKKAGAIDPKSVKSILRQGQLYGRSKNYQLALDYYRQAAVIDSSFAPAYREQGELYYMAKQYDKAKYYSKKYVDLTGGTISSRVRYAQFLFLSKDYKKAIEEITSLQKEDTTNNVLNRLLGYASFETGEFAKGAEAMNKFFARAPKEKNKILASDFEYLGKNYAKSGKDSLGILNLEKAITMDSSATNLYGDIALIYSKQKRNDKAAEYYVKKIEGKKDVNINDHFNLGKAYYFGKDYVKADTAFGTVISMQPKLNLGYLWRGRAQSALDPDTKTGAAKPYYEKLIEVASVDPVKNKTDLVEGHSYMAYYYYLVAKDNAKSKESWLKVKEIDPANEKAKKSLESLK